jgi:hypothetical protein
MIPGDTAVVNFAGNPLHGKRVRIERIDPAMDIAHPDCAERLICPMAFISHPSLPQPVGINAGQLRDIRQGASHGELSLG